MEDEQRKNGSMCKRKRRNGMESEKGARKKKGPSFKNGGQSVLLKEEKRKWRTKDRDKRRKDKRQTRERRTGDRDRRKTKRMKKQGIGK